MRLNHRKKKKKHTHTFQCCFSRSRIVSRALSLVRRKYENEFEKASIWLLFDYCTGEIFESGKSWHRGSSLSSRCLIELRIFLHNARVGMQMIGAIRRSSARVLLKNVVFDSAHGRNVSPWKREGKKKKKNTKVYWSGEKVGWMEKWLNDSGENINNRLWEIRAAYRMCVARWLKNIVYVRCMRLIDCKSKSIIAGNGPKIKEEKKKKDRIMCNRVGSICWKCNKEYVTKA